MTGVESVEATAVVPEHADRRPSTAEVRERGYAENLEETADGLYTASVPVVNDEGVTLAALTTCIPVSRITPERRAVIVDDLRGLGRNLSEPARWLPSFSSRHR